ncbi:MAG TPA: ABC transporter permease [Pseudonocardiaceae bacterium]|nr:ABC transporter permease [Pseudonocardiaceae bacterium]
MTLLARQRNEELALLRGIGATPAQLRTMMIGETAILAIVAAAAATIPATFAGRLIVRLLKNAHQLPTGVPAQFGGFAIGIGAGITLLAAILATTVVARRMTSTSVADALRGPSARLGRSSALRLVAGLILLLSGVSCAILTMTAFEPTDPILMGIAAEGAILCAIGFGLLTPWLLTATVRLLGGLLRLLGVPGWLATLNLGGRAQQAASAVTPIIVFTGIATGTLYMQGTENAVAHTKTDLGAMVETLNYLVVGMIALFAAIMVVNTLAATTVDRRREFGQLRLAGSTPPQVVGMVGVENTALAAVGVLAGTLASTATAIPYSIARTGSALPSTPITVYLGVVATACVLTLASGLARPTTPSGGPRSRPCELVTAQPDPTSSASTLGRRPATTA